MQFRRFRIAPHWLTLGLALVLGVVAFQGARSWLAAQARAAEARVAADHTPQRLLVAAVDLETGTVLLPELLASRQVPRRFATSSAVRAEDAGRVEGQQLVHPVKAGEPILWPALSHGGQAAFSAQLDPGRRAVTFAVDEINAFAGLLVPGDVIDLLYTERGGEAATVRPLLEQVTVLATGTTTREDAEREKAGLPAASFATVTLGVTPADAQRIVLAQQAGELTALLRHPADAGRLGTTVLQVRDLRGDAPLRTARARGLPPRGDYVEFIVGGARESRHRQPVDVVPAVPQARADEPPRSAEAAPASLTALDDLRARLARARATASRSAP
ncbi:MAG: Flp pilus assembly protein CpaB [Steroidobacteraceae bacterium]|jgi:pilus assembly protein CpaB|nr:Flp pilus assembly protein CpaB [Steroidobacteraceae bacterium]